MRTAGVGTAAVADVVYLCYSTGKRTDARRRHALAALLNQPHHLGAPHQAGDSESPNSCKIGSSGLEKESARHLTSR